MKRFLYYFISIIVIGLLCHWSLKFEMQLKETASATFKLMPVVFFGVIFPIVIGLLLRLPQLIIDFKENNHVQFDWAKFFAVSIPTLYVILSYILSYAGLIAPTYFLLIGGQTLVTIAGIVFGYNILNSIQLDPH